MEQRPRAKSILEFLVAKNPPIRRTPTPRTQSKLGTSNTRTGGQWVPQAFEEWAEFDPKLLKTIYGGDLWKVIVRKRQENDGAGLIDYPFMSPFDLQVSDEASTTCVIHKWNQTMVTSCLMGVEEFQPSIWRATIGMNNWNQSHDPRLRPDGGAVSIDQSPSSEMMFLERLPKDYKPTLKWDSRVLRRGGEFINDEGEWAADGMTKRDKVLPIRQAYTYCVEWGCRYGCIISTKEAFIFRIKPRSLSPGLSGDNQVKKGLERDGLMEYVTIPWDNYGDGNTSKPPRNWTMNLALWFVHVLAGNRHKVATEYPSLRSEQLEVPTESSVRKPQTSRKGDEKKQKTEHTEYPKIVHPAQKRAREDDFVTSFSRDSNNPEASQSNNSDTGVDTQSQGSDTAQEPDNTDGSQYATNQISGYWKQAQEERLKDTFQVPSYNNSNHYTTSIEMVAKQHFYLAKPFVRPSVT